MEKELRAEAAKFPHTFIPEDARSSFHDYDPINNRFAFSSERTMCACLLRTGEERRIDFCLRTDKASVVNQFNGL